MGTTLACILYLGHIKLIKYYIFATRTVVRSRATGWVFKETSPGGAPVLGVPTKKICLRGRLSRDKFVPRVTGIPFRSDCALRSEPRGDRP